MSIKVIDLNDETKEEAPALEPIEEEPKEAPVETPEIVNEVVEETNEEPKPKQEQTEDPKPKPKAKPKPKPSDLVFCPDCSRQMTYKNLRYCHKCSPEPPPVKKQAKPKAKTKPKATPKPPPEVYYSESEEEEQPTQPLIKKKQQTVPVQPINPVDAMAQHYMILQQQMIQQKQERYNKICSNMFAPRCLTRGSQALRPKKR